MNESLKECAKYLFTASENIRQCLDSLELEVIDQPLKLTQIENLKMFEVRLEAMAKLLKRKSEE